MNAWEAIMAAKMGAGAEREIGEEIANAADAALGDGAHEKMLDELAELFRARGMRAADAMSCAVAMLAWSDAKLKGRQDAGAIDGDMLVRIEASRREMLREIEDAELPKLQARILRIAIGVDMGREESMRKVATAYGRSVEAISKQVAAAQEKHRLPKNQFNKSEAACNSYRFANRENRKLI